MHQLWRIVPWPSDDPDDDVEPSEPELSPQVALSGRPGPEELLSLELSSASAV